MNAFAFALSVNELQFISFYDQSIFSVDVNIVDFMRMTENSFVGFISYWTGEVALLSGCVIASQPAVLVLPLTGFEPITIITFAFNCMPSVLTIYLPWLELMCFVLY